jgi:hypothetical protein
MESKRTIALWIILFVISLPCTLFSTELIPALDRIKTDRPRIFLRPQATPFAVSLEQLRGGVQDEDYRQMLDQLREQRSAAAQAMVWLLTGDTVAADSAIARMQHYEVPDRYNTFHIHSRLTEFGLTYDWLYNYRGFTDKIKAELREKIKSVAWRGLHNTNDHIFHNYVWMSGGGAVIWALAIAGEDEESSVLFEQLRQRFNQGLFPTWRYLDGLPSEPLGYWTYYVFNPGVLTLLGAQSAFEKDILGEIEKSENNWLVRHYENMIQSVLPDMRFIPWGDLQSGSNGGVTIQFAGIADALAWALKSLHGVHFSQWLAEKRGLKRFYGWTPVFYMIYTRNLETGPEEPPLSFLAGGEQSGHFIARSGWDDSATVVSFGCKDHFGDHHHYDQGGFMIYRNGLLAVDPPVYRKVAGPQQPTSVHNTLLISGQEQRKCRGQWFKTLEEFEENRVGGNKLETGDILFYKEGGTWAAVAGQFAQACAEGLVESCVRQFLFVRPDKIVVVDHLVAPPGKTLPDVQWLLQLPQEPEVHESQVSVSNGASWLRCQSFPTGKPGPQGGLKPVITVTDVNTYRVSYSYDNGKNELTLIHLIEVGDGAVSAGLTEADMRMGEDELQFFCGEIKFKFLLKAPYEVSAINH